MIGQNCTELLEQDMSSTHATATVTDPTPAYSFIMHISLVRQDRTKKPLKGFLVLQF